MQYVVLPLSAFRPGPPAPAGTIDWGQVNLWLAHVFCVGLPIAFASQMGRTAVTSDNSVMMSGSRASSTSMRVFLVALALAATTLAVPSAAPDSLVYARLESYLEALRVQAGIPGLSAAIVGDTDIVWERGFGRQDLAELIAAQPDTPFHLDGLGQTLTATLVLQCVEQGKLSLDDPSATTTLPARNLARRFVSCWRTCRVDRPARRSATGRNGWNRCATPYACARATRTARRWPTCSIAWR